MAEYFYEREKLHNEVWADPTTTVAQKYGVSDVAIHKACKRLNVPVPPRGYWAKVAAGKKVKRQPLEATNGPTMLRRHFPYQSAYLQNPEKVATVPKDKLSFLEGDEREKAIALCDNLRVKDRLIKPHPLVKQDQETRAEQKRKEREERHLQYWQQDHRYWSNSNGKLLDVSALPAEMPRVYRILDAIFRVVEELGGTVKLDTENRHTLVALYGEHVRIRLKSSGDALSFIIEDYHSPRKNWNDGKTKQIEDDLGSIVIGIFECAHVLRAIREERRREEEERRQAEIRRWERERQERAELQHFQELEKAALDWQRARTIECYIAELEIQIQDEPDMCEREKKLNYIAWAREKIRWLDPFVALKDPILGKRHRGSS
jgi:hypothetical protein